jgi:hypothetical protein
MLTFLHKTCTNCSKNVLLFYLQLSHVAVWGSIATWFLFVCIYSHMWPAVDVAPEMVGMVRNAQSVLRSGFADIAAFLTSFGYFQVLSYIVIGQFF